MILKPLNFNILLKLDKNPFLGISGTFSKFAVMSQIKLFITGIGTNVGKTVAAAIVTEALEADYWKPVQAGDLHATDSQKVAAYLSNAKSKIHQEAYRLATPASPHYAAAVEDITILTERIKEPETVNHLVIEGAGGIFVPLNSTDTIADIIKSNYKVILVSRHYLGSINHTLLSVMALEQKGLTIGGIIFSGDEAPATESVILKKTGLNMLGRIENEPYFDKNVIRYYADIFRQKLLEL